MKVVTRQNRQTGEMNVDYTFAANQLSFRYCLLKNIIGSRNLDITLLINTNQRIASRPIDQIETSLRQMGLSFRTMQIESNPRTFFGVALPFGKKQPMDEHKIVVELGDNVFSKELFETIRSYDVSFGFGKNKPLEEICIDYRQDDKMVLFNEVYFQESLYDSVVCETLRCSFNVEQFVRKTEYEIAV